MKINDIPIGFIGCGNMALAILSAIREQGFQNFFVFDPNPEQTEKVSSFAASLPDGQAVIQASKYIFLCVKPQIAPDALKRLDFTNKIPVSIMAGTTIESLKTLTNSQKIVRVMPNLNAEVKMSYNAYVCDGLNGKESDEIRRILSAFGLAVETTEDMLAAVTGFAGSGPAFVFQFFKGLLCEAQKHGFSPAAAIEMCGMMIAGSVGNILHSVFKDMPNDFDAAIDALENKTQADCSKGGTTEQGVNFLREKAFAETVSEAVSRAVKRAEELSK